MTSAAVTQSGGSIMNLALQKTDVRTDGSGTGFTSVMDSVSKNRTQDNVSESEKNSLEKSDQTKAQNRMNEPSRQDEVKGQDAATDKQDQLDKTSGTDHVSDEKKVTDQQKDEMERKAGEEVAGTQMYQDLIVQAAVLMEQMADSFSVGTQDVMDAMQQLDMNLTDLLDPENMKALALAVAGEDQAALLTDEDLYRAVQDLMQLSDEAAGRLQETLNISEEEWNGLLEKMSGTGNTQTMGENISGTDGQNQTQENADVAVMSQGTVETEKTVHTSREAQNGQTKQEASVQKEEQQIAVTSYKTEDSSEEMQDDAYAGNGSRPNFADTMQNPINEIFENPVQGENAAENKVDVEQIMKQILEQMKTRNSNSISALEMQLHPASLGNLHISVASKNGVVTAQFATENEAVKEALEGQVMILKENLEQQGVRVEAVEVTVASHEFERNLEQEAGQEEQEAQNAEAKKKGVRRINLNSLEDGIEEADDAERITRDMMMRHGASLDYLA